MKATTALKSVSVIIPTTGENKTISEAVMSVLRNQVLEVIVVSKTKVEILPARQGNVRVVVAPDLNISQARNLGIEMGTAEIVAFTDDDCTVAENWVSSALTLFKDETIAIVGGPGITDPNDSDLAKCAGAVLASPFATFSCAARYSKSHHTHKASERNVSTCNLFFRRSTLKQVGLFSSEQYPCEENDLIERIQRSGYKVIYSPSCVVYHHRRPLFLPFLKQISFYGAGRALFIVRRPRTFRPMFIGPSVMFLMTITIPLLYVFYLQGFLLVATLHILYFMLMLTGALRSALINKLRYRFVPIIFAGIVLMHYCYGLSFIKGLAKSAWRADS